MVFDCSVNSLRFQKYLDYVICTFCKKTKLHMLTHRYVNVIGYQLIVLNHLFIHV